MNGNTRARFLEVATRLFAERGFYGASISGIATELGLTKQALIHHFGSKERLYGEVLQQISDRLLSRIIQTTVGAAEPGMQLENLLMSLYEGSSHSPEDMQLLLRELLDNKRRAEQASSWYLKPFLDALVALTRRVPGWEAASNAEILASIYQLLGAINFFAISEPTLTRMFGPREYAGLKKIYPARLRTLIQASLASPPS